MSSECCQSETIALKQKLEKLESETRKLKQEYQQLLIENLQKDVTIKNLKEKLEQHKYGDFKGIFSDTCLDGLRTYGNSQIEDSRFIGSAMRDLYRDDVDALKKKTLSGRSKNAQKSAISPKKMKILKQLFDKRMSLVGEVDDLRKNNLSKLIRNAIDNARK